MLDFGIRAAMTAAKFALNTKRAAERKKVKFLGQRPTVYFGEPIEPLDRFLAGALPDAIDTYLYDVANTEVTGSAKTGMTEFDVYLAKSLVEAGAERLREINARVPLALGYDKDDGMFYIDYDEGDPSFEDELALHSIAATFNRLKVVLATLDGLYETRYGNLMTAADYSARDWNVFTILTQESLACLSAAGKRNKANKVFSVSGEEGGDWDALGRFFRTLMKAAIPVEPYCVADIDTTSGLAVVEFDIPDAYAFPKTRWAARDGEGQGAWVDASSIIPDARMAYSVRLCVFFAADAFASSENVKRVIVNAREETVYGDALISIAFEREAFLSGTADALESGAFDDAGVAFSAEALVDAAAPAEVRMGGVVVPLSDDAPTFLARRTLLIHDARPLPDDMAELLGASLVSDLSFPFAGDAEGRLAAIDETFEDAPLLAIAQMEDVLASVELPDDGAHPMHFTDGYARIAVGHIATEPGVRYTRLPNIYVRALEKLSRYYSGVGRNEEAVAAAKQCVALAPSSPDMYVALVDAYRGAGDAEGAIEAAKQGLVFACQTQDVGFLYFRLGAVLDDIGRPIDAIGCFNEIPDDGEMWWMENVNEALERLYADTGTSEPSWSETNDILDAAGIPGAPTEETSLLFIRCMVRLFDAGVPYAALFPALALINYLQNDEVDYDGEHLSYVTRSMEWVPRIIAERERASAPEE